MLVTDVPVGRPTGAGEERDTLVPSPSWPLPFCPQHTTPPDVIRPQECEEPVASSANGPIPIAVIGVTVGDGVTTIGADACPTTSAGALRVSTIPSPSWPLELSPQQTETPVVVIAQACVAPTAISSTSRSLAGDTATGRLRLTVEPSPSWPEEFEPQQYAAPVDAIPHVVLPPAAIRAKRIPDDTATAMGNIEEDGVPSPSWPE